MILVRRSKRFLENANLHLFAYGRGGSGKTKLAGDIHRAGCPIVVVTTEMGEMTLDAMGVDCPIITPTCEADLIAIVQHPEAVVERIIHPIFENYIPGAWIFDNAMGLQMTIFGEGPRRDKKDLLAFDGAIELPKTEATGIMALPNTRDASGIPAPKDYRLLDMKMRSLISATQSMPYHTLITAHAEKDYSFETAKEMTGDPKKDKEVVKRFTGYPMFEGFKLKYNLPELVSDFYLYMEWDGTNYYMYPTPYREFYARTRLAAQMKAPINWTNKNGFELIMEKYKEARKKNEKV